MIELRGVRQVYAGPAGEVAALDGIDLDVGDGELVCLRGPSGSGKSTLLMSVGGMRRPTEGCVRVAGQDLYALDGAARAAFRARHVGFVFQTFHLVPYLDVADNVLLAAASVRRGRDARGEALETLAGVGLGPRARHRPDELSAGERQRAAIARALFARPTVVLADEPTGNLDPDNACAVLELLAKYRARGGTVLLVTHGELGAEYADRELRLEAGRLVT